VCLHLRLQCAAVCYSRSRRALHRSATCAPTTCPDSLVTQLHRTNPVSPHACTRPIAPCNIFLSWPRLDCATLHAWLWHSKATASICHLRAPHQSRTKATPRQPNSQTACALAPPTSISGHLIQVNPTRTRVSPIKPHKLQRRVVAR